MNFLFDIAQEGRIADANRRANQAVDKAIELSGGADTLKRRLDVMALANQALFEILQSRLGLTEEEVIRRMAEIDGRDGVRDGKMGPRVVKCHHCGKPVSTARQRCMYCGGLVTEGHLFEKT